MKVMAIGTLKPSHAGVAGRVSGPRCLGEVSAALPRYLDDRMEQFWLRDRQAGVIFLMNVESVDEADRLLKGLPLGQADLLTFG